MSIPLVESATAADAPANDLCGSAEVVPSDGPFPWNSLIIPDITGATTNGDPALAWVCEFYPMDSLTNSLWYSFTPAESGLYQLSFHGDTATTVEDTIMAVYTSANGCNGPFTEIDCNDDTGLDFEHNLKSAVVPVLDAGVTYYIVVWLNGQYELEPGFSTLQFRVSKPEAPPNDNCSNPIVIPGDASFPYLTPTVDSLLATEVNDPTLPSCRLRFFARRSLWYEFTPQVSSVYTFSTCRGTETRIFDTLIGVYTSENGCNGPFVEVGCNDTGCQERAELTQLFEAGTTYYIVVWDTESEAQVPETDLQLRVALPPAAFTLPATELTSSSAVLNGIVRANSTRRTWFYFQVGTDTNYNLPRTDLEFLFMGSLTDIPYRFNLTGLSANTSYHYRLVVTNNASEIAYGADQTFTWNSTPPTLTNQMVPTAGEGSFEFQFLGQANQLYDVQASTNLTNWTYLGPALNLGEGNFSFTDTNTPPLPKRFYRLVAP